MGTLLYIILKVLGKIDLENDWVNICFLVAIDSVAAAILIHALLRRRSGVRPGSETKHESA